ncbi:hypothetical protein A3D88_03465 [Candidatus Peribacteria bacterium RIFCSPHIGHO2_02_FULL_52_16]|nr:MAG: hypothetical protein A2706_04280 [Candidatus Peribacteria bacterium RIFCSPHIGHO2_01_FULL_51_35]OGJ61745.1 MAG: hypothetical protein A3D88_03465 [Candidatus Peribacteria bacterium RIFCSPHIGHO2_02_FULL_52_16]
MKILPSAIAFSVIATLALSACGTNVVSYRLDTDAKDARLTEVLNASKRVIERRLQAMGEESSVDIENTKGEIHIRVAVEAAVADALTQELTAPFSMRIMTEAPAGKGDINVEGQGSFQESGITEEHLVWVTAGTDANPEKGRVLLEFSEDGRRLMGDIFRKNKGKYIGLFVRNHLVSKLLVEAEEVKESILITDIPSILLAQIFADDLNVGLHATFTRDPS